MSQALSDAALTAWGINSHVNQVLLGRLDPAALRLPVNGGWTVLQHFAHMTEAKTYWAGQLGAAAMQALPKLPENVPDEAGLADWRKQVARLEEAVLETTKQAADTGHFAFASRDVFLLHLTHHDTHHRALILNALRQARQPVPDDGALWAPWRVGGSS